jgi:hypothetical protein
VDEAERDAARRRIEGGLPSSSAMKVMALLSNPLPSESR